SLRWKKSLLMWWEKTMRNVWLIARREYLERVRTRSFMIMTVLIPVLMAGLMIGPSLLADKISHRAKHLVVVASTHATGEAIRDQMLQAQQESRETAQELGKSSLKRTSAVPPELTIDVDTDTGAAHK